MTLRTPNLLISTLPCVVSFSLYLYLSTLLCASKRSPARNKTSTALSKLIVSEWSLFLDPLKGYI